MRPLVVLVSGAPGSGKTTLASTLARRMKLPHIERDRLSTGAELTLGERVERSEMIPKYYRYLETMLADGISLVTDGTIYSGVSEEDIKQHLVAHAVVINVHVRASDPHGRFYQREKEREKDGWSSDWVEAHMERLKSIHADTVDPLALGVEVVEVRADDGYEPSIEEITATIKKIYERDRIPSGELTV